MRLMRMAALLGALGLACGDVSSEPGGRAGGGGQGGAGMVATGGRDGVASGGGGLASGGSVVSAGAGGSAGHPGAAGGSGLAGAPGAGGMGGGAGMLATGGVPWSVPGDPHSGLCVPSGTNDPAGGFCAARGCSNYPTQCNTVGVPSASIPPSPVCASASASCNSPSVTGVCVPGLGLDNCNADCAFAGMPYPCTDSTGRWSLCCASGSPYSTDCTGRSPVACNVTSGGNNIGCKPGQVCTVTKSWGAGVLQDGFTTCYCGIVEGSAATGRIATCIPGNTCGS